MNASPLSPPLVIATWHLQLRCVCPSCKEPVDLIETRDFWDGRTLEPLQRDKTIEARCPQCEHIFEAETDY